MSHNTARTRNALYVARHRERRRAGMIVLPPWAVSEQDVDFLIDEELVPPHCENPMQIIEGIKKLLEYLRRECRE
jgi:hypothetical protein